MKKIISIIIILLFLLMPLGCNNGGKKMTGYEDNGLLHIEPILLDKYDLKEYTSPFWKQDIMVNESIMFVGKEDCAPLLYNDVELVSLQSSSLNIEYIQNKDFTIKNGCISLTENTNIPYWELNKYYPSVSIPGHTFAKSDGKGYIYFSEGSTFTDKQLSVTYRHKNTYNGFIPDIEKSIFNSTIKKLSNNQELKVLFYGDSISVGCNSTSYLDCPPYAPIWPKMVVEYLSKKYNNNKIIYTNTAVGGMTSEWGVLNVQERVNNYNPDIIFIGFGMNDQTLTSKQHKSNIKKIINSIRENNMQTDIIIISPMLANKEANGFYVNQNTFEYDLVDLETEYDNLKVARVTSFHESILKHKRYYDMTANNVNHPNDFLARIYCQTILETLLGNEYVRLS